MPSLYLATQNPGKIREVNRILDTLPGEVRAEPSPVPMPQVLEDGDTFEANARKKALALSNLVDGWVLADDSGLAVDALGGEPGIHSARYGEPEVAGLDDAGRVRLLLERMEEVPDPDRGAHFVCVLALARGGVVVETFEGICDGVLAREPRGAGGFGYDPVFLFPAVGRTFGELPPERKDGFSHRGRALWRLAIWFSAR